jgi:hypothetical protein
LILSESHNSNNALFIKALAFIACNLIEVKNVILEGSYINAEEKNPQPLVNTGPLINLAKQLKLNYSGTDEKDVPMSYEDFLAMYTTILKNTNDLIFVVGNEHHANISNSLESSNTAYPLTFKVCTDSPLFKQTPKKKTKSLVIQAPTSVSCEDLTKSEIISNAFDVLSKHFLVDSHFSSCTAQALSQLPKYHRRDFC